MYKLCEVQGDDNFTALDGSIDHSIGIKSEAFGSLQHMNLIVVVGPSYYIFAVFVHTAEGVGNIFAGILKCNALDILVGDVERSFCCSGIGRICGKSGCSLIAGEESGVVQPQGALAGSGVLTVGGETVCITGPILFAC